VLDADASTADASGVEASTTGAGAGAGAASHAHAGSLAGFCTTVHAPDWIALTQALTVAHRLARFPS
jgi:hypothetical protein